MPEVGKAKELPVGSQLQLTSPEQQLSGEAGWPAGASVSICEPASPGCLTSPLPQEQLGDLPLRIHVGIET